MSRRNIFETEKLYEGQDAFYGVYFVLKKTVSEVIKLNRILK